MLNWWILISAEFFHCLLRNNLLFLLCGKTHYRFGLVAMLLSGYWGVLLLALLWQREECFAADCLSSCSATSWTRRSRTWRGPQPPATSRWSGPVVAAMGGDGHTWASDGHTWASAGWWWCSCWVPGARVLISLVRYLQGVLTDLNSRWREWADVGVFGGGFSEWQRAVYSLMHWNSRFLWKKSTCRVWLLRQSVSPQLWIEL